MDSDSVSLDDQIPGTVHILDLEHKLNRKHKSDSSSIILVPAPSQDPNDPLNWVRGRKMFFFCLILLYSGMMAAITNDYWVDIVGVIDDLNLSAEAYIDAGGIVIFLLGYTTAVTQPFVNLYGRRPVYILCSLLAMFSTIIAAKMTNLGEAFGFSILLGIGASPFEVLSQNSIADAFFEHERGTYIAWYVFAVMGGNFLGPMVSGYISDAFGWRYMFWFNTVGCAVTFIASLCLMEESIYRRNPQLLKDDIPMSTLNPKKERQVTPTSQEITEVSPTEAMVPEPQKFQPKPLSKRLALISPQPKNGAGYMARFIGPLKLFRLPAVLFTGVQWGTAVSVLVFFSVSSSEVFSVAPYHFSASNVGLTSLSVLIGSLLATVYGGNCGDRFVLYLAKRNGGIKEAEFRIWLLVIPWVIMPTGLFVFGIGAGRGLHWAVPCAGLLLIGFGIGCIGEISFAYLIDSYTGLAGDGMVPVAIIRNSIAGVITFLVQICLDNLGTQNAYVVVGLISFLLISTAGLFLIWGKQWRKSTKTFYLQYAAQITRLA